MKLAVAVSAAICLSALPASAGEAEDRTYFSAAARLLLIGHACGAYVAPDRIGAIGRSVAGDLGAMGYDPGQSMQMIAGVIAEHGPAAAAIVMSEAAADPVAAETFCDWTIERRERLLADARNAAFRKR